jgi:transcriptional regulator with XRE-family HTH domain
MSRQELAEAVNAHVYATTGRRARLDAGYIGKLERGEHRWPRADHRQGLRAVLGVATDAEIGMYNRRRNVSDELFLASDPASSPAEGVGEPLPVSTRPLTVGLRTSR